VGIDSKGMISHMTWNSLQSHDMELSLDIGSPLALKGDSDLRLYIVSECRGIYKGSNDCHYRDLHLSKQGIQGKRRITRNLTPHLHH
jgi:hypothetical protein